MKRLIITLSIIILICSCKKDTRTRLQYTISPITQKGEHLLKIKLDVETNGTDKTILLFQDQAWGQDSLHNVIRDIKIPSEKAEITSNRDSGWFEIKHPKGLKKIDVEYIVKQDTKGDLVTRGTYRPVIQPGYFHAFSHNLFMLPKNVIDSSNDDFDVTLKWEGFSEDYKIANSFGSNKRVQTIENTSEEKFHTAVFVGGDFRIYNIDIKENNVAFIIRGEWEVFNDSTMVNMLRKTVATQRDFWQDHTQDYFAVTMIPTLQERGSSFQGSGLTHSFATNASNNKYLEVEGLVYLFNHELQHNWTGHIIKNDDEEKQYWFSEGFTDYYTIKNIAKGKIYNLDESYFINEFNGFVKALFTSSAKELPNSEMTYDNFWSGDQDIQKLPYRRGALFAFYLDQKIKQDNNGEKSLDDVLLDFKNDAIQSQQKITHPYFIATVNKYLKEDVKPFFDKHIEHGELYDLESIYKAFNFQFEPKSKVFDLGFKFSEDKKSIVAVDENSEAYKAGMRSGDLVRSRSYYYDSTDHEAEFILVREGKDIDVKYMPVKEANIPQLKDNTYNKTKLNL